MSAVATDFERIWLEGRSEGSELNGRMWCEHNVWDDEDPAPTEYVRGDIADAWKTEAETLLLATHLGTHAVEALTAERDALETQNAHIRDRDIGLIQELIDALMELHGADDCINLARATRLDELRRDLDLMK